MAVFGEVPAYASEVVLWAEEATEMCASVVKRNVLLSTAAAGGFRAAVERVQIALGHCALLEELGLSLCPILSKLIRPSVAQALKVNLTSIIESVGSLAGVDNWTLDLSPHRALRGPVSNLRLTSSGHRFLLLMQVGLFITVLLQSLFGFKPYQPDGIHSCIILFVDIFDDIASISAIHDVTTSHSYILCFE